MSMRFFVRAAAALVLASSCGDAPSAARRRPDVVLIVVDTLRRDRLSCYGYPRETSPFLDAATARGVVFEDVTAQAPWTLPSMVSLFHGRYLTDYRDALDPDLPALAESFSAAGYRTLALVSNCAIDPNGGFARGFDAFDVVECWEDEEETHVLVRDIEDMREELREPLALALARNADGERPPLFLYLHSYDPHSPYYHHPELDAGLPRSDAVPIEPPGWQEAMLARYGPPAPPKRGWTAALLELARERGQYDQEVRFLDEGLRALAQDLERAGVGDGAVYALVADHGECLWEHVAPFAPDVLAQSPPKKLFYQKHGALSCRGIIETPFLLWGGNVPEGKRIAAPVENIDLYPTLLELADIPPPAGLDGQSLVPLMRGERAGTGREHVFSYGMHSSTVREIESGLKLVVLAGKSSGSERELQLYDLAADPHERNDLGPERPQEIARLAQRFRAWIEEHPTTSNLKVSGEQAEAIRAELERKLSALGYTGEDTGLDVGEHSDE